METAGKKVSAATMRMVPINSATNRSPSVGNVPERGNYFLLPRLLPWPGDEEEITRCPHRHGKLQVVVGGVAAETGESAASLPVLDANA